MCSVLVVVVFISIFMVCLCWILLNFSWFSIIIMVYFYNLECFWIIYWKNEIGIMKDSNVGMWKYVVLIFLGSFDFLSGWNVCGSLFGGLKFKWNILIFVDFKVDICINFLMWIYFVC